MPLKTSRRSLLAFFASINMYNMINRFTAAFVFSNIFSLGSAAKSHITGIGTASFEGGSVALLNSTACYHRGTKILTKEGYCYVVASRFARDAHLTTSGGMKLYVKPKKNVFYTSMFGIEAGFQTGEALSNAIRIAAKLSGRLVVDVNGMIEVTGKVGVDARIFIERISNLHITLAAGCTIRSSFDLRAEGTTSLFAFWDCDDITIDGSGSIEVAITNNPPTDRTTFRVFHFYAKEHRSGPDNIRFHGPLRIKLGGEAGFQYDPNYAGYAIHLNGADDPGRAPIGFVCDGVDFSGSSGRLIQTVGAKGARITRNKLENIGSDFLTVGIRSLGDATDQIISSNQIKAAPENHVFSCITIGTNNVGRTGVARKNMIIKNCIRHTGRCIGIFINASKNTYIKENVFISDGTRRSTSVVIRLSEVEVKLGADEITSTIFSDNFFDNVATPLRLYEAPVGGHISDIGSPQ